ncbi:MAG: phasin family protein [Ideonella sp.]|nr:phasin family protein [Ideonella sp.]MCC7456796.1 phasin family protein [Nitrospira sp.]
MVKKLKAMADKKAASPAGLLDNALAQSIKDSAQQIWLAGMGAFAKAQAEGTQAFDKLIKDGVSLQKKTQGLAEEKISEVTGKMTAMAGEVTAKAGQHWDKLESIFEQRTAKAMGRLGVPSAKEMATLNQRIDELSATVAKLAGKKTPAKRATRAAAKGDAGKAATTRTATKKTSRKPAARA